jgi:hypothetical protein
MDRSSGVFAPHTGDAAAPNGELQSGVGLAWQLLYTDRVSKEYDRFREHNTASRRGQSVVNDPHSVQMNALRGMSYTEGQQALRPSNSVAIDTVQMHEHGGDHDHADAPAARVSGPMGRIFNRILEVEESREDTAHMKFDETQLRTYLDTRLKLCEEEWFRDIKVDGAAEKLMASLDKNRDGFVDWAEFQGFQEQVLENLAPGTNRDSTPEEIKRAALAQYATLNSEKKDSPNSIGFDELQRGVSKQLPEGIGHKDIVGQLAARIALVAVDKDGGNKAVADRTLSESEWTTAALDIHNSSRQNVQ